MNGEIISAPKEFIRLKELGCIAEEDIVSTDDGFYGVFKSLSDILLTKGILSFPDNEGNVYSCDRFFDDWFLYGIKDDHETVISLVKLREQEDDFDDGVPADGDTPGVTISFIAFNIEVLFDCLANGSDQNRIRLSDEIGRVVSYRGQKHHRALKSYFIKPEAKGSYLVASLYVKHIMSFVNEQKLEVPEHYKEIVQRSISNKRTPKLTRLPDFIEYLNEESGRVICDNDYIYFKDEQPTTEEALAILATHTGNTSVWSFAAEVEYHARFLMRAARARVPFFGISIYESAIRADMTIDDTEFEGPAPFYRDDANIVKRQKSLHNQWEYL